MKRCQARQILGRHLWRAVMYAFCVVTFTTPAGILAQTLPTPPTPPVPATVTGETEKLQALFDDAWDQTLRESPTWASQLGDRRFNDAWPNLSLQAIAESHANQQAFLNRAEAIDAGALGEVDRLNLRLFKRQLQTSVDMHAHKWWLIPLDHRWGIQTADTLGDQLRFANVKDYEDWIKRLERLGDYMDQTIALMRKGIADGRVHAKVVMQRLPRQIKTQIVDDPTQSRFYNPLSRMPATLAAADRERLQQRAQAAIRDSVVPAYERLLAFFENNYLPASTAKVGVWQLPGGADLYAAQARMHTTTDLTPDAIHEIGLAEVKRIRDEMEAIRRKVHFDGDFDAFLTFMRTDKQFFYDNGDDLLTAYRALAKRIDPAMVKLFRTLPRIPYGVEPIPQHIAPDTTTAYYNPPASDGSRAGIYFVNLYRPETRPKWEMQALSLHEAVPGHHHQIALAIERGDLPHFRRHAHYTAYTEGWALYCETLGEELGLYETPYDKFGQLTYEMWRAIRLVVDTGIHHKGWTRKQAIDFFKAHAPKSELDITNEVDRYIAWPGQALAYKIGQLKIKQLRAQATQTLGDRFDIKAFHDVLLLSGAVPLDILEENVDVWVARVQATRED